jgi:hypothetical protein
MVELGPEPHAPPAAGEHDGRMTHLSHVRRGAMTAAGSLLISLTICAWFAANPATAQADSWTEIYRYQTLRGPVSIAACKQSVPSAYGPMWKLKVLYDRHSTGYGPAELLVWRGNQAVHHHYANSWWIDRLTIIESYASAWFDDTFSAYILKNGPSSGGYGPSMVSMSRIGHC